MLDLGDKVTTLVMHELPADKQRETHIQRRGNFMDPDKKVEPAVPAAFQPFPQDAPRNRLGLAKWLVDKKNPLTARVTVNRFWARLFGNGIVETEEDFGNQGSSPSHPKLLDWLATEFMRLDWDMKGIQKKIVMSATYRQSSDATAASLDRDPNNRLLARGPRVRLSAEMVRDQLLSVSGLLSEKMYGPPVMPLQPEGVWQVVYSGDRWETSKNEDRYRRAIYTLWRRTSPYPSMTTFDAPSGEVCTMRRIPTNTPLQALVALNDPLSMEAAQHLADRLAKESPGDIDKTIERAFSLTVMRPPEPAEVARLHKLYDQARSDLNQDSLSARQLLKADRIIYDDDRKQTVLPISRENAQRWRYNLEQPPEGWQQPSFDASAWAEGEGVFGHLRRKKKDDDGEDAPDKRRIRSNWESEQIFLRREFELDDTPLENFTIPVEYRGDYEIWINGVHAASSSGDEDVAGSRELKIPEEAVKTLHPGRCVIAVAARRTVKAEGDQYIDVGLNAVRKPDLGAAQSDDADRAAWVMVAHVLLNLDETLTKR